MQLKQFKNKFFKTLSEIYPSTEVESFFRLLAEAYLGMSRLEMALQPERELPEEELHRMEQGLERLSRQEPVQYILGSTEFFGLPFIVDKHVLIPRPETEELVEWILSDVRKKGNSTPKIFDIGTGSGCIAVSLAKNLPAAEVTALDISVAALEVAKKNAELNQVKINFLQQDILQAEEFPGEFDIVVSNPPYVRELEKLEMKPNVVDNEPSDALFVGDENPLLFYSKIAKLASEAFRESGSLYFEINQYLSKETEELVKEEGFDTQLRKDIFGNFRMLKGEK